MDDEEVQSLSINILLTSRMQAPPTSQLLPLRACSFSSTLNCFCRVQQESSFPACRTHSTAFSTTLSAIRSWQPYKRSSQTTWTLSRKKKDMSDIAQGLRTCSYQERTAQRPVSLSRSRFTCTASRSQVLQQRALASEKIKRGSGVWVVCQC